MTVEMGMVDRHDGLESPLAEVDNCSGGLQVGPTLHRHSRKRQRLVSALETRHFTVIGITYGAKRANKYGPTPIGRPSFC